MTGCHPWSSPDRWVHRERGVLGRRVAIARSVRGGCLKGPVVPDRHGGWGGGCDGGRFVSRRLGGGEDNLRLLYAWGSGGVGSVSDA